MIRRTLVWLHRKTCLVNDVYNYLEKIENHRNYSGGILLTLTESAIEPEFLCRVKSKSLQQI